jgi:hypothetical protein
MMQNYENELFMVIFQVIDGICAATKSCSPDIASFSL